MHESSKIGQANGILTLKTTRDTGSDANTRSTVRSPSSLGQRTGPVMDICHDFYNCRLCGFYGWVPPTEVRHPGKKERLGFHSYKIWFR